MNYPLSSTLNSKNTIGGFNLSAYLFIYAIKKIICFIKKHILLVNIIVIIIFSILYTLLINCNKKSFIDSKNKFATNGLYVSIDTHSLFRSSRFIPYTISAKIFKILHILLSLLLFYSIFSTESC